MDYRLERHRIALSHLEIRMNRVNLFINRRLTLHTPRRLPVKTHQLRWHMR